MNDDNTTSLDELFGEAISTYTRSQAIDDGMLVDVSKTAREAGFKISVAMTRAAWDDCVQWTEADTNRQTYQDEAGRLWDVVFMAGLAARRKPDEASLLYCLYRVRRGGRGVAPHRTILKMVCGPGDQGEPVITIMLPGES